MLAVTTIVGVSALGYFMNQFENESELVEHYENIPLSSISTVKDNNSPSCPTNTIGESAQDFKFNNMVPFFRGSGTNQNMRGTGVAESNYLSSGRLTPHYNRLSNFVGCDKTYLHKREVPNMFSPSESRQSIAPIGNPESSRPDLDRYTTSILRRPDKKPFESVQVGPGINIDAKQSNSGLGFNAGMTTSIKPNNVNEYRLNSLPGRMANEKSQHGELPTALPGSGLNMDNNRYGVPKNKGADLTCDASIERRPFMPTATQLPTIRSDIILPSGTDTKSNTYYSFGQSVPIKEN